MANSVSFQYFQTVSDCRFSLPTAAYQCCYGNEVVELIQRCHRVNNKHGRPECSGLCNVRELASFVDSTLDLPLRVYNLPFPFPYAVVRRRMRRLSVLL